MKRMTATGRTAALVLTVLAATSATSACTSSSGAQATQGASGGATSPATQAPSTSATDSPTTAATTATSPLSTQAVTAPSRTGSTLQPGSTPCTTAQLGHGAWKSVPGSSGAGHTAADISFQNTSSGPCTLTGFPGIVLRGASGNALPTHVTNFATAPTAVTLAPGAWAHSELRFSPDIPGPGEPQDAQCEPNPVSATVQIPGDSHTVTVTLDAPTPVCEQGAIEAKGFSAGAASPAGG
jgi:hypothetical protein